MECAIIDNQYGTQRAVPPASPPPPAPPVKAKPKPKRRRTVSFGSQLRKVFVANTQANNSDSELLDDLKKFLHAQAEAGKYCATATLLLPEQLKWCAENEIHVSKRDDSLFLLCWL